ncbi:MAG TPA: DUF898 family protein [Haliscomenobacter sp.]|nr:DUF898 family protein [Haliscomenobacter sp.]
MEILDDQNRQLSFWGEGSKLFGIFIVNMLLTLLTLGLYYPWARAATLKYLYQETEFEGSRFTFHGTGKEMFIGFIRAVGIILALYLVLFIFIWLDNSFFAFIGFLIFFAGTALLTPIAIHGAMRYRMSRTSWRGIHFGYRGQLSELIRICIQGFLLTLVTFGIYSFWFEIKLRRYVIDHIRFGNAEFSFKANGTDWFALNLAGYFITLITLGIYGFWWMKDRLKFLFSHVRIQQDEETIKVRTHFTAGNFFELTIINGLLMVFTLGLATPWVMIRNIKYIFDNLTLEGAFDADALEQTEDDYRDATGDDLMDALDMGLM